MAASLGILVIRSSLVDWWSMKKECRHARHNYSLDCVPSYVTVRRKRDFNVTLRRPGNAEHAPRAKLVQVLYIQIRIRMCFGPPGSGSISQRYGPEPFPTIIKQK
jgi:hypothetical protein